MSGADAYRGLLYIPVEIKHREMFSRLFLACCAAEAGFGAVVGRHADIDRYLDAFPAGVFFDKCVSWSKLGQLRKRFDRGFALMSIDEEAGGLFSMPQVIEARYNLEFLRKSALTFFWSQRHLEIVRAFFDDAAFPSAVVGNPRFDLCGPKLRKVYEPAAEAIRAHYGDFILLVSNFGYANYADGPEKLVELARKHRMFRDDAEFRTYMGRVEHKTRNMHAFADALPAVRAAFPDLAIVVRPHPAENVETWREIARGIDRCHVVLDGEANPWLMASRAMFHHGCTTGLESFILEKPSVSFHPHPHEQYDREPSVSLSLVARTRDELIDHLRTIVEKSAAALPRGERLQDFALVDNGYAADRIVGKMLDHARGQRPLDLSLGNPVYWMKRIEEGFRASRPRWARFRAKHTNVEKFPPLYRPEIDGAIGQLRSIAGRFFELDVRRVSANAYIVQRGD
jgi:surface carbohydrate biosynthesis protein